MRYFSQEHILAAEREIRERRRRSAPPGAPTTFQRRTADFEPDTNASRAVDVRDEYFRYRFCLPATAQPRLAMRLERAWRAYAPFIPPIIHNNDYFALLLRVGLKVALPQTVATISPLYYFLIRGTAA